MNTKENKYRIKTLKAILNKLNLDKYFQKLVLQKIEIPVLDTYNPVWGVLVSASALPDTFISRIWSRIQRTGLSFLFAAETPCSSNIYLSKVILEKQPVMKNSSLRLCYWKCWRRKKNRQRKSAGFAVPSITVAKTCKKFLPTGTSILTAKSTQARLYIFRTRKQYRLTEILKEANMTAIFQPRCCIVKRRTIAMLAVSKSVK